MHQTLIQTKLPQKRQEMRNSLMSLATKVRNKFNKTNLCMMEEMRRVIKIMTIIILLCLLLECLFNQVFSEEIQNNSNINPSNSKNHFSRLSPIISLHSKSLEIISIIIITTIIMRIKNPLKALQFLKYRGFSCGTCRHSPQKNSIIESASLLFSFHQSIFLSHFSYLTLIVLISGSIHCSSSKKTFSWGEDYLWRSWIL